MPDTLDRRAREERAKPNVVERHEIAKGRRIEFVIEASGFLYKMARGLVGTLVAVGQEKLTIEDVERVLKTKKRTQEITTAPAEGLCLEKVYY